MINKSVQEVAYMFNRIASRYDFLNHLLAFGRDKYWRRQLVKEVAKTCPQHILDVATGTGDLAFLLYKRTKATVIGVDVADGMLDIARKKQAKKFIPITFMQATAAALPFPDHSFDVVSIAFGVRNFEHLHEGLYEIRRVLKPGGMVAILEFTTPHGWPMKPLYRFYSVCIIPLIGRIVSKHASAYSYLPATIAEFPQREKFISTLTLLNFKASNYKILTFGICGIYIAKC
ncbi:MAG: bifunctional demethylmenaquinone methyltransferase/2-methoxy-6-polyprenyl-1,4-benzoquinol methylase UbiE [Prevotellaceae bacterium]|jgi:demethylmenaquinone methyltransferase/2-methoxy-6-polyprenyl-1,4-benzoquinol methylase|nr:bifunctional demethylmenaquinone methyltransferase/2-methoxy-6-polyprenyl-1,4-benzoquinol methylase UbiE [Prevotellaceae bacterium]